MDLAHVRISYEGKTSYRKRVAVVGIVYYDIVLIPQNECHWHIQTGILGNSFTTSSGFRTLYELELFIDMLLRNINHYKKVFIVDEHYKSIAN